MFRVAYKARLLESVGAAEIDAIERESGERNAAKDLTSIWLLSGRLCIHGIEGPPAAVRDTLESIWDDPRIEGFTIIDMAGGRPRVTAWPIKVVRTADYAADADFAAHPAMQWIEGLSEGGLSAFFGPSPSGSKS